MDSYKDSGDFTASSYGTCSFTPDSSAAGYIDYANLTENDVIGWVQGAIDTTAPEASLDADLAEQASPTILVFKFQLFKEEHECHKQET